MGEARAAPPAEIASVALGMLGVAAGAEVDVRAVHSGVL